MYVFRFNLVSRCKRIYLIGVFLGVEGIGVFLTEILAMSCCNVLGPVECQLALVMPVSRFVRHCLKVSDGSVGNI